MSKKGRTTSQATRAARTLVTIRHMTERDDRHASALESGTIEEWRMAWDTKASAGRNTACNNCSKPDSSGTTGGFGGGKISQAKTIESGGETCRFFVAGELVQKTHTLESYPQFHNHYAFPYPFSPLENHSPFVRFFENAVTKTTELSQAKSDDLRWLPVRV